MTNPKLPEEIKAEIGRAESPWGDVVSDVIGEVIDTIADAAKDELCRRNGLAPGSLDDKPGPLPKNSILRHAKTVEELGLSKEDLAQALVPLSQLKRVPEPE